jgi:hypothetical protein
VWHSEGFWVREAGSPQAALDVDAGLVWRGWPCLDDDFTAIREPEASDDRQVRDLEQHAYRRHALPARAPRR